MKKIISNKSKLKFIISIIIMLAVLGALCGYIYATVTNEQDSYGRSENAVGSGRYYTYSDLVNLYEILCCYHGGTNAHLTGSSGVILSAGGISTTTDDDGNEIAYLTNAYTGTTALSTVTTSSSNPYSGSYTTYSYNYYVGAGRYVARPKEAYILAEMTENIGSDSTFNIVEDNSGNYKTYSGSISGAMSYVTANGETIYTVNQTYVLKTDSGTYYVEPATDSSGTTYYRYKLSSGSLITYNGKLSYTSEKAGLIVELGGVYLDAVYYEYNGVKTTGGSYPGSGTLYLIDYDTVAEYNGSLYYCEIQSGYSYVQFAWWSTVAGSHGSQTPPTTSLQLEAEAFEAYIAKVASTDTSTFTSQAYSFTDSNGNEHTGTVEAPVITYEPEWNEDANQDGTVNDYDDVTVTWDSNTQTWTVGPFSINYVEESYDADDRDEVVFAGIINATVSTNLGELDLSKWKFNWIAGKRDVNDTFEYPHANEVFYIEINYEPGITEITNIHFDFKYMNAGGAYESLTAKYYKHTWTSETEEYEWCSGPSGNETTCSHGETSSHVVKWLHYVELTSAEEKTGQLLAYGYVGARWYEYTSLDDSPIQPTRNKVTVKIVKEIVDENGNKVTTGYDTNQKFKFVVLKDGSYYRTIYVKGNASKTFTYSWMEGESAPTFSVYEVLDEETNEYKQYGDIVVSGEVRNGGLIKFTAKNYQVQKEGYVSIKKELIGTSTATSFTFKLYIDNEVYVDTTNGKTAEDGTITVAAGETWTSNLITWTGSNPSYKVKEINLPEGCTLVNMENDSGKLLAGGRTVKVVAVNKGTTYESGTLTVKKVIDGSTTTTDTFTFDIKVGDNTYTAEIAAGETWSRTFYWETGTEAPSYEVTETNLPEGWELVGITNQTGQLSSGGTVEVVATNKATEKTTTIRVTKTAIGTDNIDVSGIPFEITTVVTGKFTIDGEEIDGSKEIVTTVYAGQTVDVATITWEGDSPSYEVTETNIPDSWTLENIANNKGYLKDATDNIINVECTNSYNTPNYVDIQIVKQIVDSDGNKITSGFDKTREFKFIVYKDGVEYTTVYLTGNSTSDKIRFTWEANESAPTISVVEVLDDDDDFVQYGDIVQAGEVINGGVVTFTASNQLREKSGYVSITKEQVGTGSLDGYEFTFKLTVDGETYIDTTNGKTSEDGTITVKVGETWTSNKITWTGDAPSYTVTETNLPSGTKLIGMTNEKGTLAENKTAAVIATNGTDTTYESGTLTVKKVLDGNASSDEYFTITIKVGDETFIKELKAGQTWSETFTWETGTAAPTYEVTETDIPDGWSLVGITNASGTIEADSDITVVVTNEGEEKSGRLTVTKETVSDDKEGVDVSDDEFTFSIVISGTFDIGNESYVDGTKKISVTLKSGESYTTDNITWVGDAPSYTVAESSAPDGWKQISFTNDSGYLEDDTTIEAVCTNYYEIKVIYDLTMEMSGIVWEDAPLNEEDKNTEDSVANGQYDAGYESGIENIEVYIWRCVYDANGNELTSYRRLATGYDEDGGYEIDFPIYTDSNGIWEAPRMEVPGLSDDEKNAGATKADYYVEFVYDGQTYEPTDFLVTGTVSEFKSASNADKSAYLCDSMAVETEDEREEFDNKFANITGNSEIDDDGTTNGYAIGANGSTTDLLYYSTDSVESVDGNTRKISELQTTDSDGYVYDQYKISATTKAGGLTYPFDDKVHLESMKKTIDKIENCLVITYNYSATYPYLLNINLGLVRRDEAEIALTKDVYSAAVVVNEKLVNYQYNEYVDFESEEYSDYLNLQLKVADANISYKLDLYESDYYYRAKVYEGTEAGNALTDYYTSIGQNIDEMDLDVYVTYKVSIYNQSDSYLASINTLTDYFDEDLELVTTSQVKYLQEANGESVDAITEVASPTYVTKKGQTDSGSWSEKLTMDVNATADYSTLYYSSDVDSETSSSGSMTVSDNVTAEYSKNYYKATVDLSDSNLTLAVGEKLDVYLTFKVRTDETPASFGDSADTAAASYVRLGTKANVAEIGSYTTYYTDGTIAGKVDKDSAPNNVDIENKNTKTWYEDDTDSAPIITLDLYTESRNVSGLAWEDEETETIDYNEVIGNGILDDGENLIGNLTTEMVEKVRVKQSDGTYIEYDFTWPTNTTYDFLNNSTLYEVTGYDSVTLTSNSAEDKGTYIFENVPAGNYVVRFYYGQYAQDMDSSGNMVLDTTKEAKTGDTAPAVYNGQDYKTTTYQANIVNDDGTSSYLSSDGYVLDSEWYDFSTCEYDEDGNIVTHNSDAIDNEARRLEVIAYSQTLDNTTTNVLATANDADADHTELYDNTYMYADTARINLNIENMTSLEGQKITVTNADTGDSTEVYAGTTLTRNDLLTNSVYGKSDVNGDKGTVNKIEYTYNIEAVDIGIEARSETQIVLDKEISSISLTTNSGQTILKAVYDISYDFELNDKTGTSTYEVTVELNEDESYGTSNLVALNKVETETEAMQNFRYIYYDDSISEGLNLEIIYQFTTLNLSEVDRTGALASMTNEEILAMADELKSATTYEKQSDGTLVNTTHPYIGEYVGNIYYIGQREAYASSQGTDVQPIVETTVRQLIDYVDNDAVFTASDNTALNSSWKSTTAQELYDNNVIDDDITTNIDGVLNVVDDKDVVYTTEERNNLILSLDTADGEDYANPGLVIATYPYAASSENADTTTVSCVAQMSLTITRTIDSQIDEDDLSYDNVAEIVKYTNTVGKKDIETIAGNLDPKGGEFTVSLEERDGSATELITFTPPTGLGTDATLTIQILIVALAALAIIVGGVVCIKKFVINK